MAIKDWKKVPGRNMWQKYKKSRFGHEIFSHIYLVQDVEGYNINISKFSGASQSDHFKTKPEALKFAKEYMRKN